MELFGNYLIVLMTENFESENSEVEKLEIVKFDIVMIENVRLLATDNLAPEIPVAVCFEIENFETEFPDLGSKNSRRAQHHLDYY